MSPTAEIAPRHARVSDYEDMEVRSGVPVDYAALASFVAHAPPEAAPSGCGLVTAPIPDVYQ